jgi:hypothetical protein
VPCSVLGSANVLRTAQCCRSMYSSALGCMSLTLCLCCGAVLQPDKAHAVCCRCQGLLVMYACPCMTVDYDRHWGVTAVL